MKKLMIVAMLMLVSTSVFASGWRAKYGPNVDPVTVQNQWDGLFQITPYCNSTVGNPNLNNLQRWNDCYNCKREEWARKWNIQFDIDTYSALCPN